MDKRTQKKKIIKEVFIFLIKFNLLLIPFYLIVYFDLSFYSLQIAFTEFLAMLLRSMGYKASTADFFLFLGNDEYPVDISRDCLGWKSIYSIFALVFATSGKIKDKLKFFCIWAPVFFVFNIFRVLSTLLIGLNFGMEYLEVVHTFIWQGITILVVVLVWYIFWLKKRNLIGGTRNILLKSFN